MSDSWEISRYVRRHWRAFLLAGAMGYSSPLVLLPVGFQTGILGALLETIPKQFHFAILLTLSAALAAAMPTVSRYFARYQRTHRLKEAPLQIIDLIAVTAAAAGCSFVIHLSTGVIESPFLMGWLSYAGLVLVIVGVSLARVRARLDVAHRAQAIEPLFSIYPDEPIGDDADDILHRVPIVDSLYALLSSYQVASSIVFALQARWGEGKTSVLCLLKRRLQRDSRFICVDFNPWHFSTDVALTQSFYGILGSTLRGIYLFPELRRLLARYGEILTVGLRTARIPIAFPTDPDPASLRGEVERALLSTGRSLVVLVDDLDRLEIQELLAVLRLTRLTARMSNVIFILAYDPAAVSQILATAKAVPPRFLEKIVQVPVVLPPIEQATIDALVLYSYAEPGRIRKSGTDLLLDRFQWSGAQREEFDREIVVFYQQHLIHLFQTLRDAKRFLNALGHAMAQAGKEVHLYDFFLLQVMAVFFPFIHQQIWLNRWYFLPLWGVEMLIGSPFWRRGEIDKEAIKRFTEDLIAGTGQKDVALAILQQLFPLTLGAATLGTMAGIRPTAEQSRVEKRLTHPECFPRYFLQPSGAAAIPDSDVEGLIERLRGLSAVDQKSSLLEAFRAASQRGLRHDLLKRIRVFAQSFRGMPLEGVVEAILDLVPELSVEGRTQLDTERWTTQTLLLELSDKAAADGQVHSLLESVVTRIPVVTMAAGLVLSCHTARDGSWYRIAQQVDLAALRRHARERFARDYREANRDIFQEVPEDDAVFVLWQWSTDWLTFGGEAGDSVRQYVMELLRMQPGYVGKLLVHFVSKHPFTDEKSFAMGDFCKLANATEVAALLEKHGESTLGTARAREATQLFLAAYRKTDKEGSPPVGEDSPPTSG